MNSSTLRRLAADHASLYNAELPPCYLFPQSSSSDFPEDLTQLTILLTGPQGTPYSQGLWKLHLKIPEDYPKNPPKASFRTSIWHPNVDEKSGIICVDTLKRDWEQRLTLRDVLITISCLLIQPNPASALNATAGQLLQEDYESFTRQAKLMTSIHASIPSHLKEATLAARRRGEEPGSYAPDDTEVKTKVKSKMSSSSGTMIKKHPERLTGMPLVPAPERVLQDDDCSSSEVEYEKSSSKENDPTLSPLPATERTARRPTMRKRPLSDLPTPIEPDCETLETSHLSPSDQNILNNTFVVTKDGELEALRKDHTVSARVNFQERGLQAVPAAELASVPLHEAQGDDGARPTKRVCSDEEKDLMAQVRQVEKLPVRPAMISSKSDEWKIPAPRKASTSRSLDQGSSKGKARIGLRRL